LESYKKKKIILAVQQTYLTLLNFQEKIQ
jgi:hypothetical protein